MPLSTADGKERVMDDLISRQAVLNYIDNMPSELTVDGRRMIRRIRLTEYIRDSLPSAQPTQTNTFKALEALDCVSRQEAIAVADSSDYVGLSVEDVKKVTDEVVKGLKSLQSVQPESQWIPCSERLPKKSGQYYVSGGDKVWICEFLIIPNFTGGWSNNVLNPVVQAWMPLPEPYKEGRCRDNE